MFSNRLYFINYCWQSVIYNFISPNKIHQFTRSLPAPEPGNRKLVSQFKLLPELSHPAEPTEEHYPGFPTSIWWLRRKIYTSIFIQKLYNFTYEIYTHFLPFYISLSFPTDSLFSSRTSFTCDRETRSSYSCFCPHNALGRSSGTGLDEDRVFKRVQTPNLLFRVINNNRRTVLLLILKSSASPATMSHFLFVISLFIPCLFFVPLSQAVAVQPDPPALSSNLGPLTTQFEAPSTCLAEVRTRVQFHYPNLELGCEGPEGNECCPSRWERFGYYSPGVCPTEYQTCKLSSTRQQQETTKLCCPKYDWIHEYKITSFSTTLTFVSNHSM